MVMTGLQIISLTYLSFTLSLFTVGPPEASLRFSNYTIEKRLEHILLLIVVALPSRKWPWSEAKEDEVAPSLPWGFDGAVDL